MNNKAKFQIVSLVVLIFAFSLILYSYFGVWLPNDKPLMISSAAALRACIPLNQLPK